MSAGDSQHTLVVTTRSGVRPLGVRGEPLHNAAQQIRRIVRRRLGDTAAGLLADPQLHDGGNAIDWYADWPGEVRPLVELEPERRAIVLAAVDRTLKDISKLGESLKGAGTTPDDTGVVGRSIQLAARRPAESFVFLVGERPVVVCWGYEKEAAAGLLLSALPRAPVPAPAPAQHVPVLSAPQVTRLPAPYVAAGVPWFRTLLAALPLLLLLLGAAWLLRELLPAPPDLSLATREGVAAPTAPTLPRQDRVPVLKASLSSEQARARALRLELAAAEEEIRKRITDCKPPEPPKVEPPRVEPPKVVESTRPEPAKPPPKEPQTAMVQPKPAPPPPQPQPAPQPRPDDGRLRLPSGPTNDYSFMQGCWRTDPFRHERLQPQAGVSSYCFDASGRGQLEWRRGRTACRTRAQAQFAGDQLQLRDADTVCNDGSQWYADRLVCQRGADNVANCSGSSRNAYGGPVSWMVNLHRIN